MSGRHAWRPGDPSPKAPRLIVGAPRHLNTAHEHRFIPVATFSGIRSGIAQCRCGETKTTWMVNA